VEARSVAPSPFGGTRLAPTVAVIAIVVCAAVVTVSAVRAVADMRKRTCIEQAEAEFPAVPVSAFSGRETGPVKVSFIKERQEAVDDC
jgi:hypothetical protein